MVRSVVTDVKDLIATSSYIIEAAQTSIVWRAPLSLLSLFIRCGVFKSSKTFLEGGGSMRGVTQISPFSAGPMHDLVQAGAAIHLAPQPLSLFMLVGDALTSISAFHTDPKPLSLTTPIVAFRTDDAIYVEWLLHDFEAEWIRSIDGSKRIRELSNR
jgi:hypothetical protein